MTLSRKDAQDALAEIERTSGRSHTLQGYQVSGPILMLWGVIWIIGYVAMGLLPVRLWGLVWIPLDLVGVALTVILQRGKAYRAAGGAGWQSGVAALGVMVFIGAVYAMFRPALLNPYLAFPGLVAGLVYFLLGLARMTRFVWIGAAMFAATLVGFFLFAQVLAFWMAATVGGGLILGGLWLRKA